MATPTADSPRPIVDVAQTRRRLAPPGALPRAEQAMGTDQGVLVPLVLWGQLLVAAALAVVWIRHRVGRWHAWVIAVPVLGFLGLTVADHAASLLPNLL